MDTIEIDELEVIQYMNIVMYSIKSPGNSNPATIFALALKKIGSDRYVLFDASIRI